MIVTVRFRRGTASEWSTKNPTLKQGEPGFESDTGKLKIGNGSTAWNALPYLSGSGSSTPGPAGASAYELAVANGYVGDLTSWLLTLKGAKGDTGDASTLNSFVSVVTGDETRPDAPVVLWFGGFDYPTNMASTDIWFSEGTPPDTTAPSVPASLFAGSIGPDRFTLSWNTSTDNVAVDHYEYRLDGGAPVTATSPRLITGLTAETLYTVEVRAVDAAGNASAWSTSIPVTTTAEPSLLSIFGASSPGAMTIGDDGGGALRVGTRFYATRPWVLRGLRFWNPPEADTTFLETDLTFYVYKGDWANTSVPAPTWAAPLQTKTLTETRVVNEWTEVLFDAPISVLGINAATLGDDYVTVGYQFAGGQLYVYNNPGSDPVPSGSDSSVYLAEAGFSRGVNTLAASTSMNYGLDILFEGA